MSTAHTPSSDGHRVHGIGPDLGPRPGPAARPMARRRPRWRAALLVAALLLPIAEIAALVATGHAIGVWWTLGLLLVMSMLGAWLMKREGSATWRALREAGRAGRMPTTEVADAAIVLVGGGLLLLPGFLSDIVGLVLLLPFTRPVARRALQRSMERRVHATTGIIPSVRVDHVDLRGASTGPHDHRQPREIPHVDLRREH